jgi:hypothetical protein
MISALDFSWRDAMQLIALLAAFFAFFGPIIYFDRTHPPECPVHEYQRRWKCLDERAQKWIGVSDWRKAHKAMTGTP